MSRVVRGSKKKNYLARKISKNEMVEDRRGSVVDGGISGTENGRAWEEGE